MSMENCDRLKADVLRVFEGKDAAEGNTVAGSGKFPRPPPIPRL
jgi:hypothetical protein